MNGRMEEEKLKNNRTLYFILRCILGGTFIYASIPKILNPDGFAMILYGYSVFPIYIINLIAIIFPFIELFSGLLLILGFFYRPAIIIINSSILFFIIIISFNLIRGHEFNCGCFAVGNPSTISAAGQLLVRDLILLVIGLYLFFAKLSVHRNSES